MQRLISGDYTAQIEFVGNFDKWANKNVKSKEINLIAGTDVGTKTLDNNAILVDDFVSDEQRENVSNFYKGVFKTDDKYLLPSILDNTSTVYEVTGEYNVYHLALQNDDENKNYGIYANGLLVETASEGYLKNRSKMELIE